MVTTDRVVDADAGDDGSACCPVLHVDMDAFYASVTLRSHPELTSRPVVVGGGHRGVVLSANYLARAHGVRSAMSGAQARRLCPEAVFLPPDHAAYSTVSTAVMEMMRAVTPLVETVSLDEAFLDVAGARRRLGSPLQIAEQLRARIQDEQAITCSVGLADSISVAKLASVRAKPDGVLVVRPDEVPDFLHPLDVGALWGVGERGRRRLHDLGLRTIGDVAHMALPELVELVGQRWGAHLHDLAWGRGRREVASRHAPAFAPAAGHAVGGLVREPDRSMGAQRTLGRDARERSVILRELLGLTTGVTARLRSAGLAARTVVLTVRYSDFVTLSRSRTLPEPTDVTHEVFAAVESLLSGLGTLRAPLRLVGVRLEGLVAATRVQRQGVLGEREHGWSEADRAVDRAVGRFGSAAVRPATLL